MRWSSSPPPTAISSASKAMACRSSANAPFPEKRDRTVSEALGIGFAIVAALTTASSHALLKSGEDQEAVRALCGVTWAAAAAIPLMFIGAPAPAILPWQLGRGSCREGVGQ